MMRLLFQPRSLERSNDGLTELWNQCAVSAKLVASFVSSWFIVSSSQSFRAKACFRWNQLSVTCPPSLSRKGGSFCCPEWGGARYLFRGIVARPPCSGAFTTLDVVMVIIKVFLSCQARPSDSTVGSSTVAVTASPWSP